MIFRKELAKAIMRGEKTATRRRMSDNPRSPWYHERCAYKVGQIFTINPGRGVIRIGEARVTAVYKQHLAEVANFQAIEEGFEGRQDFIAAWCEINGSFDSAEIVWVVEFEVSI